MAKLTQSARNKLPSSAFAGPARSYPIPDASHARNAKARASQAFNAGRMSAGTKEHIDAMANKKLTMQPEEMPRPKMGRGHETPGLGTHSGSKVHGGHKNVVNEASHGMKLKHC